MKKPDKLDPFFIPMFNAFVKACNDSHLLVESLDVDQGISEYQNRRALAFRLEVDGGLTNEEATNIFKGFTQQYPECGVNYNLREVSALEKAMSEMDGVTVMRVTSGFKLTEIEL